MSMKKTQLRIEGMHCASCAHTIEKAVKKIDGVEQASVNYGSRLAAVSFDPRKVSQFGILKSIEKLGYKAFEESAEALDKEEKSREKETGDLKIKLAVGVLLSIPVFFGSFPETFNFIPQILQNPIILLILATPVQFFVGSQFYTGFWLALKNKTADMNT